jgi:phosphatidylinositol alpha-mannosyltransferase
VKIALVSPYDYPYPGGVTEHISHLKEEFTRRGHTVKIIAPSSSPKGDLGPDIYRVGGIVPLPVSGSIARITLSPSSYRAVKRILNHEAFDVVHLHEPLMPVLPLVVLRHSKTLNIGTFHAYRETHLGYYYGKPILQRFWARLHGRICVSEAAYALANRYFPGEYRIIPNGIDVAEFSSPTIEPIPHFNDGRPNILFLGRMDERKGFRYLLNAFPYVKREFPEARLIVAGGYTEEDVAPYRRQVAQLGLTDVHFVGFIPHEEKPRYYRTCHIFCAPSTGFESQGIVLLEAMAAGRPIVAGDIPGYRSVVTHGQEGFLVPPRDETAIAAALVHLLADPALRERMGQAGRARAALHSWDRIADQILTYYQETTRRVLRRRHLLEVLSAR